MFQLKWKSDVKLAAVLCGHGFQLFSTVLHYTNKAAILVVLIEKVLTNEISETWAQLQYKCLPTFVMRNTYYRIAEKVWNPYIPVLYTKSNLRKCVTFLHHPETQSLVLVKSILPRTVIGIFCEMESFLYLCIFILMKKIGSNKFKLLLRFHLGCERIDIEHFEVNDWIMTKDYNYTVWAVKAGDNM